MARSSRRKRCRGDAVAGDRAGLDQRGALPILPDALIIGERGCHRHRQRGGRRVRAQPQIGAKNIAIAGALVENAHEIAGKADEEGLDAVLRSHPRLCRVVKKDQVDIARIIELVAAKLAHAEDDEPAVPLRIVRVGEASIDRWRRRLRSRWRSAAPIAASANRLSAAVCCSSDQAPASSATAASKRDAAFGDPQAPHQRRRIFAEICVQSRWRRQSPRRAGRRLPRRGGSGNPTPRPRGRSETGCCRRSRASRRLPAGVALHGARRADCRPVLRLGRAPRSRPRSPRASRRWSAGSGSPLPSGER